MLRVHCPMLSNVTLDCARSVLDHHQPCKHNKCIIDDRPLASHVICSISRFSRLQDLTLNIAIDRNCTEYMCAAEEQQAARTMYTSIQNCKDGISLRQLNIVLIYRTSNIFGKFRFFNPSHGKVIMSCTSVKADVCPESSLVLNCDDRSIVKIAQLRQRAIERKGGLAWNSELGPYLWERRQGNFLLPSLTSIEWLIRTALPASFSTKSGSSGSWYGSQATSSL